MGFKLNYALLQPGGGVSLDGTNTIALPDNRQTGLNDAEALLRDITFANTVNISKFLKASNTFQTYTGRKSGGTSFPLGSGDGYYIKMATTVNYIVVGSDDPALSYPLTQPGGGTSLDGTNFYAYNYHQTATDAEALLRDITFANTVNVSKFLAATNTFQTYTGRKSGGTSFALAPGQAYYVKMATTVNYIPSHY
jgi:hypothetical protein